MNTDVIQSVKDPSSTVISSSFRAQSWMIRCSSHPNTEPTRKLESQRSVASPPRHNEAALFSFNAPDCACMLLYYNLTDSGSMNDQPHVFDSSGCGHCKKMKPEYDEAAELLNKGAEVGFLVDCMHVCRPPLLSAGRPVGLAAQLLMCF